MGINGLWKFWSGQGPQPCSGAVRRPPKYRSPGAAAALAASPPHRVAPSRGQRAPRPGANVSDLLHPEPWHRVVAERALAARASISWRCPFLPSTVQKMRRYIASTKHRRFQGEPAPLARGRLARLFCENLEQRLEPAPASAVRLPSSKRSPSAFTHPVALDPVDLRHRPHHADRPVRRGGAAVRW
jgi:hypothetical protein